MERLSPLWGVPSLLSRLLAIIGVYLIWKWILGKGEENLFFCAYDKWMGTCLKTLGRAHTGISLSNNSPLRYINRKVVSKKRKRFSGIWVYLREPMFRLMDDRLKSAGHDGWPNPLKHSSPIVYRGTTKFKAIHALDIYRSIHSVNTH